MQTLFPCLVWKYSGTIVFLGRSFRGRILNGRNLTTPLQVLTTGPAIWQPRIYSIFKKFLTIEKEISQEEDHVDCLKKVEHEMMERKPGVRQKDLWQRTHLKIGKKLESNFLCLIKKATVVRVVDFEKDFSKIQTTSLLYFLLRENSKTFSQYEDCFL